jgi:cell division protein FtsI (penicillin-binding protein 3)
MKQMLQGVVLFGTGRKALLEGYTSAGKSGTAQKIDPATGAYSRTKYVASFAGFAPVNSPAVTVAVILDSPVGLHMGGQVSAPVFQRVAQQVLAYLNVPHDLDIPQERQLLLASKSVSEDELAENSPDRLGAPLELPQEASAPETQTAKAAIEPQMLPTEAKQVVSEISLPMESKPATPPPQPLSERGTVVMDMDQGGIVVPSFLGKPLRMVIEISQSSGVEVDAIGSGIARDQSPAPGVHVPAGSHVEVRFER